MVIKMGGVGGMGAGTMRTKCRDTTGVGMILRYVYVRTCVRATTGTDLLHNQKCNVYSTVQHAHKRLTSYSISCIVLCLLVVVAVKESEHYLNLS